MDYITHILRPATRTHFARARVAKASRVTPRTRNSLSFEVWPLVISI